MHQPTQSSLTDIPGPLWILSSGGQNQKRAPGLDQLFFLFGNPHRRSIFELLCHGEHTIEELAARTYGPYQGIRKQLIILEAYGVITSYKDGKYRYYHANSHRLMNLRTWVTIMEKMSAKLN